MQQAQKPYLLSDWYPGKWNLYGQTTKDLNYLELTIFKKIVDYSKAATSFFVMSLKNITNHYDGLEPYIFVVSERQNHSLRLLIYMVYVCYVITHTYLSWMKLSLVLIDTW